eukprot:SAG11_NODE_27580_length_331_cov_0.672414_1_plen_47_part_10
MLCEQEAELHAQVASLCLAMPRVIVHGHLISLFVVASSSDTTCTMSS